ncbi:MAG: ABC transporter permease subunit [Clostridia bacterium]|nr:ABC transporter permease subunit [Clostridia bacterium]
MWAVIKKEFKSYFLSPVGYVFIGLFLLMFSIFFYTDVVEYGSTNFEYIFYSGATVLTFIVPILTMRLFAEERKTGTEQLLMTSPLSITSAVLAKFIAALFVIIITELCTLMYFGILCFFGIPDIATSLITLLGFLLLAMSYISFGMLASSLTENQIIAGIITIGFFVLSWFLPNFSGVFTSFSLINLFSKFVYGQIDIADTVTFISFTVMCILLTIMVLQRRKSVR